MSLGAGRVRIRLLSCGLAIAFVLATADVVLRLSPRSVSGRLGNAAFSVYGSFPGGIFFRDRIAGLDFMHPKFATTAYANGYRWLHETDTYGFRSPPDLDRREVLVLGDSMIYGHGLGPSDTVADVLRVEHGLVAYNMARPGDCLFQQYVLLRLYLDRFQPRRVILFVFWNDFLDLLEIRTAQQIDEAPEIDAYDYEALAERVRTATPQHSLWDQIFFRSRALRLLAALSRRSSKTPIPNGLVPAADFDRVVRYYDRILADLNQRIRERGAELEVVLLDHPSLEWGDLESRLHDLLELLSRSHGFDYRSTGSLLESCADCLLPGDGHLSGEGARRVAAFLARRASE